MTTNSNGFMQIASEKVLQEYIASNLHDPWVGTPFQGYRYLDNKQKGEFGEQFTAKVLEKYGHTVEKSPKSHDSYDRIVNKTQKVEIKFSLSHTDNKNKVVKEDCFTMNHVSLGKEWDRLVFIGVNYDTDKSIGKFMEKETFEDLLTNKPEIFNTYFSKQQGGKDGNNDDYISADKKLKRLIESEYMHDLHEW